MVKKKLKFIVGLTGLSVVIGAFVSTPVWARDPMPIIDPATGSRVPYYDKVFVPAIESQDVNLQSTVYEIYLSLVSSIFRATYQCDAACASAIGGGTNPPGGPGSSLTPEQKLANRPKGLIPELIYSTTAFISKPPISSTDYLAYVGEKLHLAPPAYAQGNIGFGYEGLAPAREIWTAFRNVAYLIATIGFVILSFMIMFRLKISAQAVIGAQQAITKLIVVFLAVTFSYAIAGLIVDLIFIFTFVIISLFNSTGLVGPNPQTIQAELLKGNIFQLFGSLLGTIGQGGQILTMLSQQLVSALDPSGILSGINQFFSGFIDVIFALILGIAVVYALIRLLFALLMSYLEIIILTILAPIMILPDILPGGNAFTGWMKRLFANAMVFPTTTFMLLLAVALVSPSGSAWGAITGGNPPAFQTGLKLPYLGTFSDTRVLQGFLGIGMILLTYKVVDMVKNALKVQAFPYSTAVGAALGAGAAGAGMLASPVTAPVGFAANQAKAGVRAWGRDILGTYGGHLMRMGGYSLDKQEQRARDLEKQADSTSNTSQTK